MIEYRIVGYQWRSGMGKWSIENTDTEEVRWLAPDSKEIELVFQELVDSVIQYKNGFWYTLGFFHSDGHGGEKYVQLEFSPQIARQKRVNGQMECIELYDRELGPYTE